MSDNWRPIPGYEGAYEVNNCGQVRSLDRVIETKTGPRFRKGRLLRPSLNYRGYAFVGLHRHGVKKTTYVHRIVARAFHGPPPTEDCHVVHLDGDKENNAACNLAWAVARPETRLRQFEPPRSEYTVASETLVAPDGSRYKELRRYRADGSVITSIMPMGRRLKLKEDTDDGL